MNLAYDMKARNNEEKKGVTKLTILKFKFYMASSFLQFLSSNGVTEPKYD